MKSTFKQGDRVVIIDNDYHGVVLEVRLDDRGTPLIDIELDEQYFLENLSLYSQTWVARQFELREEGENGE